MYQRMLSLVAVAMLAGVSVAKADQAEGTVEKVEPETKTVWVGGNPYHIEDDAAPLKFEELKVGSKIVLEFDGGRGATRDAYRVEAAN